jgi:hypothetical protein
MISLSYRQAATADPVATGAVLRAHVRLLPDLLFGVGGPARLRAARKRRGHLQERVVEGIAPLLRTGRDGQQRCEDEGTGFLHSR